MNRRALLKLLGALAVVPAAKLDFIEHWIPSPQQRGFLHLDSGVLLQWGTTGADGTAEFPVAFHTILSVCVDRPDALVSCMSTMSFASLPHTPYVAVGINPKCIPARMFATRPEHET